MIQPHLRSQKLLYQKRKCIKTLFIFHIYYRYSNIMNIEKHLFNDNVLPKDKTKLYNILYCIENNSIFSPIQGNKDTDLADLINKNYSSMTPEEMRHIALKCLTDSDIKHILLKYELQNLHREPSDIHLNEFEKIAVKKLLKYQSRAGGFCFGDRIWKIHDSTSKKYHIYDNELVFENTLDANSFQDHETIEYLNDILLVLNEISTRIKVTIHSKYSDRDKIYIMMLKCKENN